MPILPLVKRFVWKYLDVVTIWTFTFLLFVGNIFRLNPSLYSFLLIVFLLTIPGYLLTISLFENKRHLASFEWILFSIVFSLALITLGSVSLMFLGISINQSSLRIFILSSIIVFSFIVLFTRNDSFQPWKAWINQFLAAKFSVKPLLLFLIIAVGLSGLLTVIVTNHNGEKFTEFSALGVNQDGSTTTTITKNVKALKIMVINQEQGPMMYHIVVDGGNFKDELPVGNLSNGGEWLYQLPFSQKYQTVDKLTLELFREDQSQPYRTLIIWFTND